MENRNLCFFEFYQICFSYLQSQVIYYFYFFKSKHLLLWNLSKKTFLKLNGLPITFVVAFIDVLSLQFTLYLLINVIILLKLDTSYKILLHYSITCSFAYPLHKQSIIYLKYIGLSNKRPKSRYPTKTKSLHL